MLQWLSIALLIFILDQGSKYAALKYLVMHQEMAIIPGLNFTLAFNNGAAFGLLAESSGWQRIFFVVLAVVVAVVIIGWLKKLGKQDFFEKLALVGVLGGALGNLSDRLRFGMVVDFLDVYYKDWHWYTFNIADIAICIGTFGLVIIIAKSSCR